MPIRKSSTAASPRAGRQSALKLFTDRDHERELLRHFFERLAHRRARPEKPILSLWGMGGIGKTSLLKKVSEELGQDLSGFRLICLDLDHDRWKPSSPVADFFWLLRSLLGSTSTQGSQGQYARAEPLLQRSLSIREKVLGPEHPNMALYLENYALCLRAVDRPTEAASLEARALAIRAKST
jgi:hypothetical protein